MDVVEESKVVRKAPCCAFCKTQDGDIDPWATPPTDSTGGSSAAGSLRIKLADGMDDYCYVLIVLQYSNLSLKDVSLAAQCVACQLAVLCL